MAKTKKDKKENKSVVTEKSMDFLKNYINNPSPVGFETSGQKLWLEYIKPYTDSFYTDPYGTAVAIINPEATFKVVIEAHADEISWFVNYINEQGQIYLKRNGGVDHQIAPSMRVFIHGKKGPVKAVFGWPAIHTRHGGTDSKEPSPKVENLTLDCGASNKKQVEELGIHIGAVVTYVDGYDELANDIAIITDVTHDTSTPMINKAIEGDIQCGKGPSLAYAPAIHNKLLQLVQDVAEKKSIPVQLRALSRSTGTDTDSFAYANDGCPSVLISIPLRYMHTTVEMIHKKDIEDTIKLMYETLLTLSPKTNLSYI